MRSAIFDLLIYCNVEKKKRSFKKIKRKDVKKDALRY